MSGLCLLALLLGVSSALSTGSTECENPNGSDGEFYTDECVRHTCKKGVWRVSLDLMQCCYQGKPFPPNSEISSETSSDGFSKATFNCVYNGDVAEMVLTVENLSKPASKKNVEDLKRMLDTYKTGSLTCNSYSTSTSPTLITSTSSPASTSPSLEIHEACPEDWKIFGSKCFKLFEIMRDWHDAQSDCESEGGNLASPHSPDHRTFFNLEFKTDKWSTPHFWIGATDKKTEGEWVWTDGTPLDYTNWCDEEPNDATLYTDYSGEDCVHYDHDYDMGRGCWNDKRCNFGNFYYMCEINAKLLPVHKGYEDN